MLTTIFRRLPAATRSFKSYHEYHAESLGISIDEYFDERKSKSTGGFEAWKEQEKKFKEITYVLDHMKGEEQRDQIRKFDTVDLGEYLLEHIRDLEHDDLQRINNMPICFHKYRAFDTLFSLSYVIRMSFCENKEEWSSQRKLWNTSFRTLKEKLREVNISRIDKEIVSGKVPVKL